MLRVFCVVEGHGDVEAMPIIVRRIASELFSYTDVVIERPYRLPKDKISKTGEITPVLELAARRLNERAEVGDRLLILVTRDADKDCPVDLAATLYNICANTTARELAKIAIADEEFESWLLAGAEGLIGHRDCRGDFSAIENADSIVSPKAFFEQNILKQGRSYSETVDQPKFAANMALNDDACARSRSLRHLVSIIASAISS